MKISRFLAVAVFGLSLISQDSFAASPKMTHKNAPKVECERSILPLFNRKENRPCKKAKHEKKHMKKHTNKTNKTMAKSKPMATK